MSCFFFFQAEDGIRDYKVTGVQTCALPISCPRTSASALHAAHKRCCAKGARKPHGFIALTVKGRICGLCLLWRAVQACGRHGKGTAAATACNCLLLQLQQQLAQALPGRCALLRIERQGQADGGQALGICQRAERSEERRVGKECRSRWSP